MPFGAGYVVALLCNQWHDCAAAPRYTDKLLTRQGKVLLQSVSLFPPGDRSHPPIGAVEGLLDTVDTWEEGTCGGTIAQVYPVSANLPTNHGSSSQNHANWPVQEGLYRHHQVRAPI